ncbi:MAG TPA: cell division protein FtsA [Clostridia bacterium]|nr:cell division protein FtsA [Clostridia bacterium]
MGKRNENIITVIDVGSAKTVALAAEITEQGLRYRGHGVAESRGSRKGVIVDLEKAVVSVQRAVEEAEQVAQLPLESAVVGISGPHIRAVNSQGGIALGSRAREISREDIRIAVDKARSISLPEDRQVLHLLPQEFILDEQGSIRDPYAMLGRQLEVRVHVITASQTATQNIVSVLNRAGMEVTDTIYEALAASDSVLRSDERELGAAVIDIGAGSTDIVVFYEGVVIHTAVVPIGGDHFTNDVAVGLRTPLSEAERIKRQFGNAVVTSIPHSTEIEVPSVGDRPSRLISQRVLGEILEPRARELMEMVRDNLRQAGVLEMLGGGIILTGGGSRLLGMLETTEDMLRKPARLGVPLGLSKLPAYLQEPEFSVAIGMIYYAHRARVLKGKEEQSLGSKLKALLARSAGL